MTHRPSALVAAAIVLSALAASPTRAPADPAGATTVEALAWLEGVWVAAGETRTTVERWRLAGDRLAGEGALVAGADTTITETLEIRNEREDVFYIATVPQNPRPVAFHLTKCAGNAWVFEKPSHDFPQRIVYTRLEDDRLHVRVEGERDGKAAGFDLEFRRAEPPPAGT